LLGAALPGIPFEVAASQTKRGLVLQATILVPATRAARAELGKLPVGFEVVIKN